MCPNYTMPAAVTSPSIWDFPPCQKCRFLSKTHCRSSEAQNLQGSREGKVQDSAMGNKGWSSNCLLFHLFWVTSLKSGKVEHDSWNNHRDHPQFRPHPLCYWASSERNVGLDHMLIERAWRPGQPLVFLVWLHHLPPKILEALRLQWICCQYLFFFLNW